MMMMIMVNCFCGMVDWRKMFSLISNWDHCQRYSPSRTSDTTWAGFEPAQSLSSGLAEWSCAVVITTTPRRYNQKKKMFFVPQRKENALRAPIFWMGGNDSKVSISKSVAGYCDCRKACLFFPIVFLSGVLVFSITNFLPLNTIPCNKSFWNTCSGTVM